MTMPLDPRGLIAEAYVIPAITPADCRAILFDWLLGLPVGADARAALAELHGHFAPDHPTHPMTTLLQSGLAPVAIPQRRRHAQPRDGGS